MVLTTAPPMIKTAARAPQSILLHFFATGFVVPEVDVAVSMASAAVISFFVRRGLGRARGACRHLAFSRPMPRASDDALAKILGLDLRESQMSLCFPHLFLAWL